MLDGDRISLCGASPAGVGLSTCLSDGHVICASRVLLSKVERMLQARVSMAFRIRRRAALFEIMYFLAHFEKSHER